MTWDPTRPSTQPPPANDSSPTAELPVPTDSAVLRRLRARFFHAESPLPLGELLNMHAVEIAVGHAVFTLEGGPQHANPMGTIHGGVLTTLADSAMGIAFASTLADGETFTTLELKINFLRPVWSGTLTAVGRVLNAGRSVALVEAAITDANGRAVAHAISTCMILRGEQSAGRTPSQG